MFYDVRLQGFIVGHPLLITVGEPVESIFIVYVIVIVGEAVSSSFLISDEI